MTSVIVKSRNSVWEFQLPDTSFITTEILELQYRSDLVKQDGRVVKNRYAETDEKERIV